METRHVKKALSASTVKTDRRDARGMAQLLRMGWFRPVHVKSAASQEVRALLVARKRLQHKLIDIELSIRGILRGFGLKIGKVTKKDFEKRICELVIGHVMLGQIAEAVQLARAALLTQLRRPEDCRPDIGGSVNRPGRFRESELSAPHFPACGPVGEGGRTREG